MADSFNDSLILARWWLGSVPLLPILAVLSTKVGRKARGIQDLLRSSEQREMTFKTTTLRDAISFALAISAAGTGAAFAQEAAAQEEGKATTLDKIEVTGTRI